MPSFGWLGRDDLHSVLAKVASPGYHRTEGQPDKKGDLFATWRQEEQVVSGKASGNK
jgi:hypothetical protein